ncbi:hypothetical protein B0H11DRAFT_2385011 [Mycena galericulata]|nr:hypothetical protein B0H11DRAFT_2385011 [Mycena galericulata]
MGRPIFEAREHSLGAFRALPASEGRGRVELDVPFMRVWLLSPDAATRFYDMEPMSPLSAEILCFPILGALPSDDIDDALVVEVITDASPPSLTIISPIPCALTFPIVHNLAGSPRQSPPCPTRHSNAICGGFLVSTFHTLLIHRLTPPARRMPLPAAAVHVYPYALPAAAEPVSASTSASAAPGARRLMRRPTPTLPVMRRLHSCASRSPFLGLRSRGAPAALLVDLRVGQGARRVRPYAGLIYTCRRTRARGGVRAVMRCTTRPHGGAYTSSPPPPDPQARPPPCECRMKRAARRCALLWLWLACRRPRNGHRTTAHRAPLPCAPTHAQCPPPRSPPARWPSRPPAITCLYQVLEVTFDALSLCAEIAPVLRELKAEEDYALDVPLLERVVLSHLLSHLLSQLAQVYASVRINFVTELVKPLRELAVEVPAAAAAPVAAGEEKPETETVTDAPGERRTRAALRARVLEPTPSSSQAQEEKPKALVVILNTEHKALQLCRALVARMREPLSELSEEVGRKELQRIQRIQEDMKAQGTERYKAALVEKGILKLGDHQKIAALDAEGLIGIQVAQLEKEKKELTERLRIVAKHVAHIEPVYRKVEQPLLAHDYEQQAADPATFAAVGAARQEAAHGVHLQDLKTKAQLARMLLEYEKRRAVVLAKKGEEYAKHKDAAAKKIEEEKTEAHGVGLELDNAYSTQCKFKKL